jgi:branched-subunit amino acid transport protein
VTDLAALVVLVVVAVGTYAMRSGLILLLADRRLPITVERALQFVGPSVLAALAVSLAVGSEGDLGSIELAEVAALVAAGVVAVRRRNLIWTFVAGMAALWVVLAVT